MQRNEFVEYIIGDQLGEFHGMSSRAMFGGFGIYREGIIIGIVVSDELYLKVDETNRAKYEAMGSAPFEYEKKDGKRMSMSYWKIPAEVIEDRERLCELANNSYEINLKRSLEKSRPKKKPQRKKV